MHNAPDLPLGELRTCAGALHANVDRFLVRIQGRGGHAAHPQEGVDTIVTGSQIVTALQTLPARMFSSLSSVIVSVTCFTAGNTWNVLPDTIELEETVRTHDDTIRKTVPEKMQRLVQGIAAASGATAEL